MTVIVVAAFIGAIGFATAPAPPKLLLWNVTASVPQGLYWISRNRAPATGELAIVRLPPGPARFADRRLYLPLGVPLLKPIAAGPRQTVCRHGARIYIDGAQSAAALDHDRAGRKLPRWDGCVTLASSQIFLMNAAETESFDGRYFGPVPTTAVLGRAVPIIIRAVDGALFWRLFPRHF